MTFQRLIDSLLGPELEPHVFGYLDDIIVATETFEEHLKWLEIVLKKLVDARLKVNREKYEFCCSSVTFRISVGSRWPPPRPRPSDSPVELPNAHDPPPAERIFRYPKLVRTIH